MLGLQQQIGRSGFCNILFRFSRLSGKIRHDLERPQNPVRRQNFAILPTGNSIQWRAKLRCNIRKRKPAAISQLAEFQRTRPLGRESTTNPCLPNKRSEQEQCLIGLSHEHLRHHALVHTSPAREADRPQGGGGVRAQGAVRSREAPTISKRCLQRCFAQSPQRAQKEQGELAAALPHERNGWLSGGRERLRCKATSLRPLRALREPHF